MIWAISTFLDFCYLVRRQVIDEDALHSIDGCVKRYHTYRKAFKAAGVLGKWGFNLPRQHSMSHYRWLIQQFGAPTGLCTSITESKHIKGVKKPYRRTNRNKPVKQMAKIVERMDKIAALRTDFERRGMLPPIESKRKRSRPQSSKAQVIPDSNELDEPAEDSDTYGSCNEEPGLRRIAGESGTQIRRKARPLSFRRRSSPSSVSASTESQGRAESSTANLPKTAGVCGNMEIFPCDWNSY